jgi:hypothetical protein
MLRALALALVGTLCFALAAQAGPARYNPRRAGHPLRIAAYAAHPFGVILDTLIFHPAWWLGQHEPLRTLFGVTTPIDDEEEVQAALRASEPEHQAPAAPAEPPAEPEVAPEN